MKKVLLLAFVVAVAGSSFAQGKGKGHEKHKDKDKDKDRQEECWNPCSNVQGKSVKNLPKKVEEAFAKDYRFARNVVWSKYKGDYTATFNNGRWRSIAVYHANGDRRDTRTCYTRQQLPTNCNWDNVFKRDNVSPVSFIQIERPSVTEKIFRVLSGNNTAVFYDQNGNKVQYDF